MRILISNDDGIDAPGLATLRRIAAKLSDDVWVVAPETNKSGAGHSLSLNEPLRMRRVEDRVYAVRGTPTDCVIMGVRSVLKDKRPDLILSGVNRGQNIAEDVTYSGTIAACFEGTLIGIRSIALSQAFGFETRQRPSFETAEAHGPALITRLIAEPWGGNVLMNVNFPDRTPDKVEGTLVTAQGRRDQDLLSVDERRDPHGVPYYWFAYAKSRSTPHEGTDIAAVYGGYISVTPLLLNLTHRAGLEALRGRLA
jgi:5'-nucleotidase